MLNMQTAEWPGGLGGDSGMKEGVTGDRVGASHSACVACWTGSLCLWLQPFLGREME